MTVQIKSAADGWLDLKVVELPTLDVSARDLGEIPCIVGEVAARLTGRPEQEFDVKVRY